jgi:hypothetical protein
MFQQQMMGAAPQLAMWPQFAAMSQGAGHDANMGMMWAQMNDMMAATPQFWPPAPEMMMAHAAMMSQIPVVNEEQRNGETLHAKGPPSPGKPNAPRHGASSTGRDAEKVGSPMPHRTAKAIESSPSALKCKYGRRCSRDNCWYKHPAGRLMDGSRDTASARDTKNGRLPSRRSRSPKRKKDWGHKRWHETDVRGSRSRMPGQRRGDAISDEGGSPAARR